MPSETASPSGAEMLHALDPDLPFVASQAAVELDNLLLGTGTEFTAVKALADRLRNSSEQVECPNGTRKTLMDLPTVEVFRSALLASDGPEVRTLSDVTQQAWSIAGALGDTHLGQDRKLLENLRAFCVALSRCATTYRHSVLEPAESEAL